MMTQNNGTTENKSLAVAKRANRQNKRIIRYRRTNTILIIVIVILLFYIAFEKGGGSTTGSGITAASTTTTQTTIPAPPNYLWVTLPNENAIQAVQFATGTDNTPPIAVGKTPVDIVPDPTGIQLYVVDEGSDAISVVSLYSYSTYKTIKVGLRPTKMVLSQATAMAYILDSGSGQITPLNLNGLVVGHPFNAGPGPSSLAISNDGKTLFVSDAGNNTVLPINVTTDNVKAMSPIRVGSNPQKEVLDMTTGTAIAVANEGSNSVSLISTTGLSVLATINTPGPPSDISFAANGATAYITVPSLEEIIPFSMFDATTSKPILVNGHPNLIIAGLNKTFLFVVDTGDTTTWYIDSSEQLPPQVLPINQVISSVVIPVVT